MERPYIENLFPRAEGQRVLQVQVSLAVRALAGDLNTLTFWGTGLKKWGGGGGGGGWGCECQNNFGPKQWSRSGAPVAVANEI